MNLREVAELPTANLTSAHGTGSNSESPIKSSRV